MTYFLKPYSPSGSITPRSNPSTRLKITQCWNAVDPPAYSESDKADFRLLRLVKQCATWSLRIAILILAVPGCSALQGNRVRSPFKNCSDGYTPAGCGCARVPHVTGGHKRMAATADTSWFAVKTTYQWTNAFSLKRHDTYPERDIRVWAPTSLFCQERS